MIAKGMPKYCGMPKARRGRRHKPAFFTMNPAPTPGRNARPFARPRRSDRLIAPSDLTQGTPPSEPNLVGSTYVRQTDFAKEFGTALGVYASEDLAPGTVFPLFGSEKAVAESGLVAEGVHLLAPVEHGGANDAWSIGRLAAPHSAARRAFRINCVDGPDFTMSYPPGMPQVDIVAINVAAAAYTTEPNVQWSMANRFPAVVTERRIARGEQLLCGCYLVD
mgnify:FL=1